MIRICRFDTLQISTKGRPPQTKRGQRLFLWHEEDAKVLASKANGPIAEIGGRQIWNTFSWADLAMLETYQVALGVLKPTKANGGTEDLIDLQHIDFDLVAFLQLRDPGRSMEQI